MLLLSSIPLAATSNAQTLSFQLTPNQDRAIQIGGEANQKGGVGAAVWNNKTYVAYTDNSGNGNLWLTYTADGTNYVTPTQIIAPAPYTVFSNSNPSLAVFNSKLYVAYVDNYGEPTYLSTTNGSTFQTFGTCGGGNAGNSPSLTAFNGYLYCAYRNTSTNTLSIGQLNSSEVLTQRSYSNISVGISPGLGVFNNTLYVAYRDTGSDNYIYLAKSTDGVNFTLSNAATQDHTSTAVSLVVHNSILYLIYRQNDTGNRLYYAYSTDGSTFSGNNAVSITMGGNPAAVNATFNCCSSLSGDLFVIYRQNDSGHYLYDTYAP
jgi:hypothetical protein